MAGADALDWYAASVLGPATDATRTRFLTLST
jgi:hypothetical protein